MRPAQGKVSRPYVKNKKDKRTGVYLSAWQSKHEALGSIPTTGEGVGVGVWGKGRSSLRGHKKIQKPDYQILCWRAVAPGESGPEIKIEKHFELIGKMY